MEKYQKEQLEKSIPADKIVVGQKTVVYGVERQEITIICNLVGRIDWPPLCKDTLAGAGEVE